MTVELTNLKTKIASALGKSGNTINKLEEVLKQASDPSIFDQIGKVVGPVVDGAKGLAGFAAEHVPTLATSGALLAGTTAGGLAYAANKSLDNEDKAHADRKALIERYRQLTHNVKTDYGL